jgi:hypothetical protein
LLRINPLVGVPLKVTHLAVVLRGEPALELRGVSGRLRRGEAAIVKAQCQRALPDGVVHLCAARAR